LFVSLKKLNDEKDIRLHLYDYGWSDPITWFFRRNPKNDFKWGGWSSHFWDEVMNQAMAKTTSQPYDLLLGRRTYTIFEAF